MKNNIPEIIFIIFAFIFGILIMFLTPKFGVPDEQAHFARAKEVSQGILYNKIPEDLSVRELNNLGKYHGASGYSPVMYAFTGLALNLTRDCSEDTQFYAGRIINLIVWILLIALAIHITPVFKWAFFVIALLPMNIFEGMSYSADSFSNAFSFLFFAYLFKVIYGGKSFSYKKDIPILIFFTIIGALCKGTILPTFLTLLIPIKKYKYPICISLILASLFISYMWSANNFIALINVDTDYDSNKYYFLTHPIYCIKMILKTYILRGHYYIKQLIGILGWLKIRFVLPIYILTLLSILGSIILLPEKINIKLSHKVFALIILLLYLCSTAFLMYCMCNTPQDSYIKGIQGRYFISILPIMFIVFGNCFPAIKYENFKIIICAYTFVLLSYTCLTLYNILQNLGSEFFFL